MVGDGRRWSEMVGDGRRWSEMVGDGRRWAEKGGDGRRWARMVDGRRITKELEIIPEAKAVAGAAPRPKAPAAQSRAPHRTPGRSCHVPCPAARAGSHTCVHEPGAAPPPFRTARVRSHWGRCSLAGVWAPANQSVQGRVARTGTKAPWRAGVVCSACVAGWWRVRVAPCLCATAKARAAAPIRTAPYLAAAAPPPRWATCEEAIGSVGAVRAGNGVATPLHRIALGCSQRPTRIYGNSV